MKLEILLRLVEHECRSAIDLFDLAIKTQSVGSVLGDFRRLDNVPFSETSR